MIDFVVVVEDRSSAPFVVAVGVIGLVIAFVFVMISSGMSQPPMPRVLTFFLWVGFAVAFFIGAGLFENLNRVTVAIVNHSGQEARDIEVMGGRRPTSIVTLSELPADQTRTLTAWTTASVDWKVRYTQGTDTAPRQANLDVYLAGPGLHEMVVVTLADGGAESEQHTMP